MSIEAAIENLTAALATNSGLLERVVAGQQAAMEKLEGSKPAGTRGTRAKATETPAPTPTPTPAATEPEKPSLPKNADEMKTFVSAWTGGTEDADERKKRVDLLKAIAAELGVAPKFDALAAAEDGIKRTVFYINRSKEGLKVDFAVQYDFDGDPAQDGAGAEEPAGDDSDFG